MVLEAVCFQSIGQVGWLVEARDRPHVRKPVEAGEQRQCLGEPSVKRGGLRRPGDASDAVPERLAVGRVVEQDGIAEIANLAADEPVRARLVPRQPANVGGGEVGRASRAGRRLLADSIRAQAGRSTTKSVAPDRRSMTVGPGRPAVPNSSTNPSWVYIRVPW